MHTLYVYFQFEIWFCTWKVMLVWIQNKWPYAVFLKGDFFVYAWYNFIVCIIYTKATQYKKNLVITKISLINILTWKLIRTKLGKVICDKIIELHDVQYFCILIWVSRSFFWLKLYQVYHILKSWFHWLQFVAGKDCKVLLVIQV